MDMIEINKPKLTPGIIKRLQYAKFTYPKEYKKDPSFIYKILLDYTAGEDPIDGTCVSEADYHFVCHNQKDISLAVMYGYITKTKKVSFNMKDMGSMNSDWKPPKNL